MKLIASAVVGAILVPSAARADIVELAELSPTATDYSLFVVKDPRKISAAQAVRDLTTLLAPLHRTPCMVTNDRGAPVSCTSQGVTISVAHGWTYDVNETFPTAENELRALDPVTYKGVKLPTGTGQTWAVNFLPPPTTSGIPCVGECNIPFPITFTMSAGVSEFGVVIDNSSRVLLTEQIVVTVNGHTLTKALPLGLTALKIQDIDPVTGAIVPITSVVIEPIGGASQAFHFDRVAFTP